MKSLFLLQEMSALMLRRQEGGFLFGSDESGVTIYCWRTDSLSSKAQIICFNNYLSWDMENEFYYKQNLTYIVKTPILLP